MSFNCWHVLLIINAYLAVTSWWIPRGYHVWNESLGDRRWKLTSCWFMFAWLASAYSNYATVSHADQHRCKGLNVFLPPFQGIDLSICPYVYLQTMHMLIFVYTIRTFNVPTCLPVHQSTRCHVHVKMCIHNNFNMPTCLPTYLSAYLSIMFM